MNFAKNFATGLEYDSFLQCYGTDVQRQRWSAVHRQVTLNSSQQELLSSFIRQMKVLVLAGTWCGDCVNQCPILDHFVAASSTLEVRYFDRDENPELAEQLQICGAARVPSVLFLSEDNFVCGRYGDRTLAKYREMASSQLGPSCPSGIGDVDKSLLGAVTQNWLDEFERIQWMLRLSTRLRNKHGD